MAEWDWVPSYFGESVEPDYTELLDIKEREEAEAAAIRETLGVPDPDVLSPEQAQAVAEQQFAEAGGVEVDAVSGPGGPQVSDQAVALQAPDPAVAQLLDAPEQPALVAPGYAVSVPREFPTPEEEQAAELQAELVKSPEQRGVEREQRIATERDRQAQERIDIEEAHAAELEKSRLDRKTDTIAARARYEENLQKAVKLGEMKIDSDNFWASRSTGQKIAGYLSAALSGWLDPTGRNKTVALIERAISQDIAVQKSNIAQQRAGVQMETGIIGKLLALGMNENDAEDTAELAYYHSALNTMQADHARFDPRGTTAQLKADAIRDMAAFAEAKKVEVEQRGFDRTLKVRKDVRESAKVAETQRRNEEQEAQAERNRRSQAWQASQLLKSREDEAVLDRAHDIVMEQKKATTSAEQARLALGPETKLETLEREMGVGGLKLPSGKPFLARGSTEAAKLSKQKAAVDHVNRILNRAIRAREKYGFSTNLLKSDEWREARSDLGVVTMRVAQGVYDMGAISEHDQELVNKIFGTSDFTEWIDPQAGMRRAQENIIEGFNFELKAQPGWEGTYVPEDTEEEATLGEAKRTARDIYTKRFYGLDVKGLSEAVAQEKAEDAAAGRESPPDDVIRATIKARHQTLEQAIEDAQPRDIWGNELEELDVGTAYEQFQRRQQ